MARRHDQNKWGAAMDSARRLDLNAKTMIPTCSVSTLRGPAEFDVEWLRMRR